MNHDHHGEEHTTDSLESGSRIKSRQKTRPIMYRRIPYPGILTT